MSAVSVLFHELEEAQNILHSISNAGKEEFFGLHPKTQLKPGRPFNYIRNPVSSKKTKTNQDFGQSIEPHGRYLNYTDEKPKNPPEGWETGIHKFDNPLYIHHEDGGWKNKLHTATGKKGKALSGHLLKHGFDGIVTYDKYGPSEVVDLTPLRKR